MFQTLITWANSLTSNQLVACVALLFVTLSIIRASWSVGVFALIAWPGTVSHEIAHAVVGFVLGAKPVNMRLFPKSLGNGQWMLGSVSFTNLRWWNAPWTAMAPLLLAPIAVWLTTGWVTSAWESGDQLGAAWKLFLCAIILQAAWPSRVDFSTALPGFIVLALGFLVLTRGFGF